MEQSGLSQESALENLRRDRLLAALNDTAGVLSAEEYPEWATSEKVARWVREIRGHARPGAC